MTTSGGTLKDRKMFMLKQDTKQIAFGFNSDGMNRNILIFNDNYLYRWIADRPSWVKRNRVRKPVARRVK